MAEKKKLGPGRHLSTIKRNRQNQRVKEANHSTRSEIRTLIKKTREAIAGAEKEKAEQLFQQTISLMDQAIKKHLCHRKTGQRTISRLHRSLSSLAS